MTFKTTEEIYRALLDGKAVRLVDHKHTTVYLKEDGSLNEDWQFSRPQAWEVCEPPKKKRTVELVEYFDERDNFTQLRWIERGRKIYATDPLRTTGNTKTVEIEE